MTDVCYVFKGAGGYIAWYFGYAKYMQEHTDLSNAQFGGSSAGSIIAAFLAAGIPMKDVWHNWFTKILEDLPPNFRFPSNEFVHIAKKHVRSLLTTKAFEQLKNKLHISLTNTKLHRTSVSEFKTKEDVISCVMTSCHIPWIIDGNATSEYQNKSYMDGGIYTAVYGWRGRYVPLGEKMSHIQIQTPYKSYQQVAALMNFNDINFHYQNYIDGYKFAKNNYETKHSTQSQPTQPFVPHFDQSTVSL